MEFSIVVPVFNEAGNVRPLLTELQRALAATAAWEVIYVDDGSDDATFAELCRAREDFPFLRVLRHRNRKGQSSALLSGVAAARGPWIITLDGDGQNDPADIPHMLERLAREQRQGRQFMLIGHRRQRRDNWVRRWSSRIANEVRGFLLNDGTPDTGCGLKLFPRDLFLSLPAFDHMHRFLPALMQRQGARVISVAVRHRARQQTKKPRTPFPLPPFQRLQEQEGKQEGQRPEPRPRHGKRQTETGQDREYPGQG